MMVEYNRHQRRLFRRFIVILTITLACVFAMANIKDLINRSEAMRAMRNMAAVIMDYKKANSIVPPESYIEEIRAGLAGDPRVGKIYYRARWIDYKSKPDEILAYVRKNYKTLFAKPGTIVIRLDGRVEWMDKKAFDELLKSQQNPTEIQLTAP